MNKIVEEIEYMEIAIANRRKIGFKKLTKNRTLFRTGKDSVNSQKTEASVRAVFSHRFFRRNQYDEKIH